jgi:hypothetical protein|tara:strand:- start:203 stop:817 length:615 start_codon:yes stop_codon:yes gene_type:complete
MRSIREIQERLATTNDAFVIEVLRWVLEGECTVCDNKKRREFEVAIHTDEYGPEYLEVKYNWSEGTVMNHMNNHIDYDIVEATHMESARKQSIDTLDAAEDIVVRIRGYLDELEEQKEITGITSEFVADAAKLIGQANASLKLVGQLKKEIGVDSQLLLAQAQVNDMSRMLVDVLGNHPDLLDMVELKMSTLREPISVQYEVVE